MRSRSWYFQLDMHGGKHSAVTNSNTGTSGGSGDQANVVAKPVSPPTSYAHRDKLYLIQFYDRQYSGAYPSSGFSFLDGWVANTTTALARPDWGMYINYADSSLSRDAAEQAYYGASLPRLQRIKAAVDPNELFYYPQSIKPNATA